MRPPRAAAAGLVVAGCCGLLSLGATAFQQPLLVPPSHSRLVRTPSALSQQAAGSSCSSRRFSSLPLFRRIQQQQQQQQSKAAALAAHSTTSSINNALAGRGKGGGKQRAQRLARLFLGAAALVLVTGGAARAFPGLLQDKASAAGGAVVATVAPIARMQDTLSQGPLGAQGPLAPVGVLLSWALDLLEVVLEGVGDVVSLLLWPVTALLRLVVLPVLGVVCAMARDPQAAGGQVAGAVAAAVAWLGDALGAYAQGVAALVASTLGVVLRFVGNILGGLFNAPGLQYLDAMDPARHITAAPAAYRAAQGIKLTSSFGLKEMYGRRWTVHAGKWNWAIPFWERCVMESQLARYRANWPKAAVKARFGFPEILRGPSPLLGGTLLVLTGIYLLYKGHVTSAIWIRQLQSETYGKQTWNPVTRLEEEEGEGGGADGSEGAGGEGKE